MQASSRGVELIARFEGLRLEAYPDPASGGEPWTIGYGTTRIDNMPVRRGDVITEEQALEYLRSDVERFGHYVDDLIDVRVNQNEFDAIVSLAYNIGRGALARSTLLRKLNEGDNKGAADEFPRWVYASGKRMGGLVRRRNAERDLFLEPVSKPRRWLGSIITS